MTTYQQYFMLIVKKLIIIYIISPLISQMINLVLNKIKLG